MPYHAPNTARDPRSPYAPADRGPIETSAGPDSTRVGRVRRAREAVRRRDAVLAMVSHDLQDPLSTILLATDFLLDGVLPAHDGHELARRQLAAIRHAATRMRRLVGDLLDASALDAGEVHLQPAAIGVGAVITEALAMLTPLAAAKGVALVSDLDHAADVATGVAAEHVWADGGRLLQVFANVGSNAIKFTPAGGTVRVSATRGCTDGGGDAIEFRIADTGPGISPDAVPHVFDRFWRARATAHLGTGLGLAIARGLVDAQGGRIDVRSVVGQGSTFAFTIPIARPGHRSSAAPCALDT